MWLTTMLTVAAGQIWRAPDPTRIESSTHLIRGSFCADDDCSIVPGPSFPIKWDLKRSQYLLWKFPRNGEAWTVHVRCSMRGDRLTGCRNAGRQAPPEDRLKFVIEAVQAARLEADQTLRPSGSKRVTVTMAYDPSFCPPWRCVSEGRPPLAPAVPLP